MNAIRNELAVIKAQTTKPYSVGFCYVPPAPNAERGRVGECIGAVLRRVRDRCAHDSAGWDVICLAPKRRRC